MDSLKQHLLFARQLNLGCPAIQEIINAVKDYFDGAEPRLEHVELFTPEEWKKETDFAFKTAGKYIAWNRSIIMQEEWFRENPGMLIHELVHAITTVGRSRIFTEGLAELIARDISDKLGIFKYPQYPRFTTMLQKFINLLQVPIQTVAVNCVKGLYGIGEFVRNRFKELYPNPLVVRGQLKRDWIRLFKEIGLDWDKAVKKSWK